MQSYLELQNSGVLLALLSHTKRSASRISITLVRTVILGRHNNDSF